MHMIHCRDALKRHKESSTGQGKEARRAVISVRVCFSLIACGALERDLSCRAGSTLRRKDSLLYPYISQVTSLGRHSTPDERGFIISREENSLETGAISSQHSEPLGYVCTELIKGDLGGALLHLLQGILSRDAAVGCQRKDFNSVLFAYHTLGSQGSREREMERDLFIVLNQRSYT